MVDRNLKQGRTTPDGHGPPGPRREQGTDILAVSIVGLGLLLTLAWIVFLAASLARVLGAL